MCSERSPVSRNPRELIKECMSPDAPDALDALDAPRGKAESTMQIGGALPEAFVPAQCMQNAGISWPEKPLVLAMAQGNVVFPAVARGGGKK